MGLKLSKVCSVPSEACSPVEGAIPRPWPGPCHSPAVASVSTSLRLLFSFLPHLGKWAPGLKTAVTLCLIQLWRPEHAGACRIRAWWWATAGRFPSRGLMAGATSRAGAQRGRAAWHRAGGGWWRRVVEAWRVDARLSGRRRTPNTGAAGGLENHERHSHLFPRGCDRHGAVLTRAVSLSQRALVDFE